MTIVEFLSPLKAGTHQDRVLAVLYYRERYDKLPFLTTDQIRAGLKSAKAKNWAKVNVADVIAKSGAYTHEGAVIGAKHTWGLTDSGRARVRTKLGLPDAEPEIEHEVGTLEDLAKKIGDSEVRSYIEEAIKCLQVGALRAAIVFVWVAAIRQIQTELIGKGGAAVTAAVQTHDKKAGTVKTIEDFAYVKEVTQLLAAKDLGLYDKSEKDTLVDALNLRNKCGHPSHYEPGIKKAAAFIEDVVGVVFQ